MSNIHLAALKTLSYETQISVYDYFSITGTMLAIHGVIWGTFSLCRRAEFFEADYSRPISNAVILAVGTMSLAESLHAYVRGEKDRAKTTWKASFMIVHGCLSTELLAHIYLGIRKIV